MRSLAEGPPAKAKKWAADNGLPDHLHPGNGHHGPGQAAAAHPQQQTPSGPGAPIALPAGGPVRAKGGGMPAAVRPGPAAGGAAGGGAGAAAQQSPKAAWSAEPWCTPGLAGQVQTAMGTQGQQRDERNLLGGTPEKVQYAPGGTNETSRVTLSNGVTGYHKPFSGLHDSLPRGFGQTSAQQPIHEVAAWRLAEQLGEPYDRLVPPCVIREVNGKVGSFAMERPGRPLMPVDVVPEGERRSAAFFDCLIGQQDRHRNNYLMAGDRLTLIDHGYAFAKRGDYMNWSVIQQERATAEEKVSRLTGAEIATLDKFLDSDDGLGLKGLLEPARFSDLVNRAERMRKTGSILAAGEYA